MKSLAKNSSSRPNRLPFESPTKKSRVDFKQEEQEVAETKTPTKTPSTPTTKSSSENHVVTPGTAQKQEPLIETKQITRRRLAFGKPTETIDISENVRLTYKLVRKITGAIGGNGSFGAIYGELTVGSMQKMANLMKEHTNLCATSRFIDVGSGIGKPNLHVIQDPGVEFSYGIEMERSRWVLGLASLKAVLTEARRSNSTMGHKCMFEHKNIKSAKTFDPFTHVYMFSIGFPPSLWEHLADMFNASCSPYLICYHSPRIIVEKYGFDVELITQASTSMHGSSEGHAGYLYKRSSPKKSNGKCDKVFLEAYELVQSGLEPLSDTVAARVDKELYGGRVTRTTKMIHCVESDDEDSA